MSFLPLSIPSPPDEWKELNITSWLESTFGWELPFTFRITTYALLILLGIILATIWVNRRLTAKGAEPWVVLDVIIWAVPLGLVGARAYHVLTHLGETLIALTERLGLNAPGAKAVFYGGFLMAIMFLAPSGIWPALKRRLGIPEA